MTFLFDLIQTNIIHTKKYEEWKWESLTWGAFICTQNFISITSFPPDCLIKRAESFHAISLHVLSFLLLCSKFFFFIFFLSAFALLQRRRKFIFTPSRVAKKKLKWKSKELMVLLCFALCILMWVSPIAYCLSTPKETFLHSLVDWFCCPWIFW